MLHSDASAVVNGEHAVGNGKNRDTPRAHWHLYLAALSANIIGITNGSIMGWTSSAEKWLVIEQVYPGPIDKATWSWIAGVFLLGSGVVPFPLGYVADKFGRKPCFLGIGVTSVISWLLIAISNGAVMILIARFFSGMAAASVLVILAVYVAEISTDDVRPMLAALMQLSMNTGYLISYSVGPYVKPMVLALVSGALPAVFLAVFIFMPESPYFLVGSGNIKGATKALAWLRGQSESSVAVKKELGTIQAAVQEASSEDLSFLQKIKLLFGTKEHLKRSLILLGLFTFAQLSGVIPVLFFTENIFRATGSSLDPAISTIIIGAVQLVASFGTLALTRFASMKALLVLSAAGMTLAHGLLGYYFYMKDHHNDVSHLGVLPLVALMIFIILYCFGYGPLPWALVGEMFGNDVKAMAASVGAIVCCVVSFFLALKFSTFIAVLGAAWTFWSFGICCALAVVFTILFVPNTRGKSLQEIQDELSGRVR